MKKLTAGIFATLLAVVSVDGAYAAIASKGYVDEKVGTVTTELGNKADKTAIADMLTKTEAGTTYATKESIADMETKSNASAKYATKSEVSSLSSEAEKIANRVTTVSDASDDTHYPTAKAVWDVVQAETSDIASSGDLSALTTRVGTLETASKTHATKTELTDGLAEKLDTATAATTYATKTELAGKQNTIAGAQLEALNSGITADKVEAYDGYAAQISGKLDTATADGKYAAKSTEGVASTASTKADTALTNIGTLTNLTTDAQTNTVAAINEVATEAAAAATAASAADGKAVAAQADVDALEGVVNNAETGLAAAHTAIDALETGKLDKTGTAARATADASGNVITTTYATKAEIADMATDENLAKKQDKTDNSLATTSKTVVGAINEVKTQADKGVSDAATAQSTADSALTKANAAIPAPDGECAEPANKCVLTYNNTVYAWEVIERGTNESSN